MISSNRKILFASTNRGKVAEVRELARPFSVEIVGLGEISGVSSAAPVVEENGLTYRENVILKAEAYYEWSGMATIADDTGLEVEALSGAPGIHSARYAGPDATAQANSQLLIDNMRGKKARAARFICELALIVDSKNRYFARGELNGSIALSPAGAGGFGYDGIFYLPEQNCTLAEAKERKLPIRTHRERALEKLFSQIS